jgi:hypothetical protein
MRSITTALGTAVLGATIALAAPAAHAATMSAPSWGGWDCKQNIVTANQAQRAYSDALADYKKIIRDGGHPDASQMANLEALKKAAHDATEDALHSCRGDRDRDHRRPHGFMHTGSGSTSQGSDTVDIAAGAGLITAVGLGAVALRRRHSGSQV